MVSICEDIFHWNPEKNIISKFEQGGKLFNAKKYLKNEVHVPEKCI
jgi:hypothetical protein